MTELQGAAVVFAPLFAIFGVCFIVFHQHISDAARRAYKDQGRRIGPQTQSPGLMIVGGIGMLTISTVIVLYAFTNVFPPPPPQQLSTGALPDSRSVRGQVAERQAGPQADPCFPLG